MCIPSSLGRIHTERESAKERMNGWIHGRWIIWMVTVWVKLKWILVICWGSKERCFLNFIWWTPINEYGPFLSMSVHMIMSVHVGEPVIVWHATSCIKDPTFSAWCLPISHYSSPLLPPIHFCSLTHFPYFTEQLTFLLCLGALSACVPHRKSWSAAQYSNVASFRCLILQWFKTHNCNETKINCTVVRIFEWF